MIIQLFITIFIIQVTSIECAFKPVGTLDYSFFLNWVDSPNCPCDGPDCTVDFEQYDFDGSIIQNVQGTITTLKLPKKPLVLQVIGPLTIINEFEIYHQTTFVATPKFYEQITDVIINKIYLPKNEYSKLILNAPFKIQQIECNSEINVKSNGYIDSFSLMGPLTIDENNILTVKNLKTTGESIVLNGFLVVTEPNSFISGSIVSFGTFSHNVCKMTTFNDISFSNVQFNVTGFSEEYCDKDPIVLVHSINGKIKQEKITYIYEDDIYNLNQAEDESNIEIVLNNKSCQSEYYFYVLIVVCLIMLLFCIVFLIILIIKIYGKLHVKKE